MTPYALQAQPVAAVELLDARASWRATPRAMRQAVDRLENLIEPLSERLGGRRLDADGCELAVGFDDILDAVRWALALQEALDEGSWPAELRVAVGIAAGVLDTRISALSGRVLFTGAPIAAATRLARRAPAGAVAVGPAAADLLDEAVLLDEADTSMLSDGAERLRVPDRWADDSPQWAGARPIADATDTADTAAEAALTHTNLPARAGRFVGRVQEFNALARLVEQANQATICGPAGAGKSRLAVEFAHRWLTSRESGQAQAWFCDLSQAGSLDEAVFEIARIAGIELPRTEALDELDRRLVAAFAERDPVLLVLDDVDAVEPALGTALERWMEQAPSLHAVRTRRRQPQPAEASVTVDSLGRASAKALLEELIRDARTSPVDPIAGERLFELVDDCGRLPLALELAARFPAESAAGAAPRPPSSPTGPPNELQRALSRSWQMLAPHAQAALQACTVFADSFSADAAISVIEAAADVEVDAAALFSELRRFSLLRAQPAPNQANSEHNGRYILLAPMRKFAIARADQALLERARHRHLSYYAARAISLRRGLQGSRERSWIERARGGHANFYRAADFGLACVSRQDPRVDAELAVTVLEALGEVNVRIGPLGGFSERVDRACQAYADSTDDLLLRSLRVRAQARLWAGRYAAAEDDYRQANRLADALGDEALATYTLSGLGFASGMQGKQDEALPMVRRAVEGVRDDDAFDAIVVLTNAAIIARNCTEIDEATRYLHDALVRTRRRGVVFIQATVLFFLGTIQRHAQQWEEATSYLNEAHDLFASVGARRGRLLSLHELTSCYNATDQLERAERCENTAMELAAEIGDQEHLAIFRLGRGRSRFGRGEYVAAELDLLESSLLLEQVGHIHLKLAALLYLAATYGALERVGEARTYFDQIEQIFERTDITRERPLCEVFYGYLDAAEARTARRRGDEDAAGSALASAYERANGAPELPIARREADRLRAYLDERVEAGELPRQAAPNRAVVHVCEEARWFAIDDDERVDISRRGPIRRILQALADKRLQAPGEPMSGDELLEAGWPDQVLTPQSASQRLHTTISRMRSLGLQEVIETVDGAYRIAPVFLPVWVERSVS